MYYNTTQETGKLLQSAKQKTLKQDAKIMAFFESPPPTGETNPPGS